MDAREVGNLFMVGFFGTSLDADLREFLEDLNPAGVILFSRNILNPEQVAGLNSELQAFSAEKGWGGLLIGLDQEGGRVSRLKPPFSLFPPSLQAASSDKPLDAVNMFARVTARELRLVGFNLNFVPVLDVLANRRNLDSSVIGDRSFGFDSWAVSYLGRVVTDGMRANGVIPCCKHFPGHGGTDVDSHESMPVDDRPRDMLERVDMAPFRAAIKDGVEMIMTAHVLYPSLDPDAVATLSPPVIDGILREEMQFDGVVITDDLGMGAVTLRHTPEECAIMAVKAGIDLLMICNDPARAVVARSAILQAVADGEITEDRIRRSIERTAALKKRYAGSMGPCDMAAVAEYFASTEARQRKLR